jgi:hypothetical protein
MKSLIESFSLPRIYLVGRHRDLKASGISVMTQLENELEELMRDTGD